MKKISILLLLFLLLSACSAGKTLIKDGDDLIIKANRENFTKQDLFEKMQDNDYTALILSSIVDKLAVFEGIKEEEIQAKVDQALADLRALYGDSLEAMMTYNGGIENFKKNYAAGLKIEGLNNHYYDAHKAELLAEYKPVLGYIFEAQNAIQAASIIKALNDGEAIEAVLKKEGITEKVTESVYTDKSSISLEVKEHIQNLKELNKAEIVQSVTKTTSAEGKTSETVHYYITLIKENDPEKFLKEFYTALSEKIDSSLIFNYYFDKYNLKVHDQKTYDLLTLKYEGVR